jgi:hypothetical protein
MRHLFDRDATHSRMQASTQGFDGRYSSSTNNKNMTQPPTSSAVHAPIPLWRNVFLAAALAPPLAALPYAVANLPNGLFFFPLFYVITGIPSLVGAVPFVLWLRRQQPPRLIASAITGATVGLVASVLYGIGIDLRDYLLKIDQLSSSPAWNVKTWLFVGLHGFVAGAVGGAIMSRFHFKGDRAQA